MKLLLLLSFFFSLILVSYSQHSISLPLLVWSSSNQPSVVSSSESPVVFYTPHQDDETLGMGCSIAESIRHGKQVYVVLFTNGAGSLALDILNGKRPCLYHKTTHHFNLSEKDFTAARNAEFIAACKALGVQRIYIANNGSGWDESIGLTTMVERFKELILFFHDQFPNASHNLISGNCDTHPSVPQQNAHRAGAIAINQLVTSGFISAVQLFRVYVYYFSKQLRTATIVKPLYFKDILTRQGACDEYAYFNPKVGRYAIGYAHSVWQLFNDSYWSEYEYIDYPDKDCP